MALLSRLPLRRQVLAAAGLMTILLAAFVVWAGYRTWGERRAELRADSEALADTVASALDQHVLALQAIGTVLGQHEAVRTMDAEGAHRLFALVLGEAPLLDNISMVDRSRRLIAAALPVAATPAGALPFVDEVLGSGQAMFGEVLEGQSGAPPVALLALPVRDSSGTIEGVIGLRLDLDRLQELFRSIPLPAGSVVTVVDSHGRVLARSHDAARFVGTPAVTVTAGGGPTVRDVDGVDRVAVQVPLQRAPWHVVVGIPVAEVRARVRANWLRNALLLTSWLALTLALTVWGAVYTSRQLEAIRSVTRQIAGGNLSVAVATPMPNLELAQLQEAFATMAARLRDARDGHERQVRHERRMSEMLQSLQRQMVRQERLAAVGQLVSGVAHEVNNPLQAILGGTELLLRHPDLSDQVREEIAFVQTQAVRMRGIVRSLSRFSDPTHTDPEPVDLRDVLTEVSDLRGRELEAQGVRLTLSSEPCPPVHASLADLTQVLLNLVVNAEQALLVAGTREPHIQVRVYAVNGRVRCEVEDNGPGVRPEDEARLFQPFFTTRVVGAGTGLGLAICHGIIHSFGGTIAYARNASGGATFHFELPAMMADDHGHDRASLLRQPGDTHL